MKKTLMQVTFILFSISCCNISEEDKLNKLKETHYLNENFVLVDVDEISDVIDKTPVKIRTWLILRQFIENGSDSIEFAEINTIIITKNNKIPDDIIENRGFIITDSLWYNKKIGDVLHFKYIRKDRFYKKPILSTLMMNNDYVTKTGVITYEEDNVGVDDDLNKDLELMELERQLLDIQRKIDNIKNK